MTTKRQTIFTTLITAAILALWSLFPAQAAKPKQETGELFRCGLVPVEDTGYDWGYIDVLGREIIKCQYDEAGDFDE